MKLDQYKLNSNSKWYNYVDLLKNNNMIDEISLNRITTEFQKQLLEDEILMKNNDIISDCCIFAPRKNSFLQKKYNLSKRISKDIFNDIIKNEIHSVIHYHRLIANLTRYYIEQEEFINSDLDIPSDDTDDMIEQLIRLIKENSSSSECCSNNSIESCSNNSIESCSNNSIESCSDNSIESLLDSINKSNNN